MPLENDDILKFPGRPRDAEIRGAVIDAVRALEVGTPERIRQEVSSKLNRAVSWNTIKKCLDEACIEGVSVKRVLSSRKRQMTVFSFARTE